MDRYALELDSVLYEGIFQHVAVPLMLFDADTGYCVRANSAADQLYGYRETMWHNVRLNDLFQTDTQLDTFIENSKSGLVAEVVIHRHSNASTFWVEASLTSLESESRRYAILSVTDVTRLQEMVSELSLMRDYFAHAQELTGLGHCVVDLKRGRQYWSGQQYHNLGLDLDTVPASLSAAVNTLLSAVLEEDRVKAEEAIRACIDDGKPFDEEWRMVGGDKVIRSVRVEGMRKDDLDGTGRAFVCASLDLTESRRIEEKLLETRRNLSRAEKIARSGTWMIDLTTGMTSSTSDETSKIFGVDVIGMTIQQLNTRIHPDDMPAVQHARDRCIADPGLGYFVQYRVIPSPGELRYVESQGEVQTDADGKPIRMVGYLRDVTDAKIAEQEIQRLAYHDEVTGLPNRVALRRQLEKGTSLDGVDCTPLALMVIDVSRFQDIYLTLGHNNSDALLKDVAVRIGSALGESIFLSSIDGSRFAAVLCGVETYNAVHFAQSILKAFEQPFLVAGIRYDINVHIGVSLFPGHADDPVSLMRKANVAVLNARQIGTGMLVYDAADDPYQPERLALLGEFRKAIHDGHIELYCQPKVDMRTDEVIGVEALVRWQHPQRGMISPALFVPLVEDTELIHALTRHMLQASVRQYFNWQREGMYVPVAVNVSPRNLLSHDLVPTLETLLHTWGGKPDWLGLEITESSLITDPEGSIAELGALSQMGFRLFIDDFGTGYSSLSYLTKMPVNVIKVDHGFTMRMLEDERSAAIVKSTIELAHNLGMTVVAEGTASKEIWDALLEFGCDEAQGYYVAAPFPASEFSAWLKSSGRRIRPLNLH